MAVAAIVAASVIGLGGAGIAAAQSDNGSSPTVTTPGSTPGSSEAPGGSMAGGCQHGGGGAGTPGEAPTAPPNQPSGTADAAAA
jgi:hypothetical protein